jgi:endonuclease YncB( thermonuclease family)
VIYITLSVLVAVGLVTCVNYAQESANRGYGVGYNEGYWAGYESGYQQGANNGSATFTEDYHFSYTTEVDDAATRYLEILADSAANPESGRQDFESFTRARVVQVSDGDTIVVDIGGAHYRVRYIGIDAPALGKPSSDEAKEQNTHLVGGKLVWLEKDISERYHYGSLFRYVWVDNILANAELVRLGLAEAKAFYPNMKYQNYFELLQAEAQCQGLGILQANTTKLPPR